MKRSTYVYLGISIALLLIACVRFEYNSSTWGIRAPGLQGAVLGLGIVGIVLLFRIFNAAQDACIAKGLIPERMKYPYDVLIPVAILGVWIKGTWSGELIEGLERKQVPEWFISTGDPPWDVAFIAAVVGVVLLIRVLTLVRAIGRPVPTESPRDES